MPGRVGEDGGGGRLKREPRGKLKRDPRCQRPRPSLDEAQASKNPSAKQTRAVEALHAQWRLVLTGTPVENRLGDLCSIFDILNPGLLGSAKAFTDFCQSMAAREQGACAPLRKLVGPYILRRSFVLFEAHAPCATSDRDDSDCSGFSERARELGPYPG